MTQFVSFLELCKYWVKESGIHTYSTPFLLKKCSQNIALWLYLVNFLKKRKFHEYSYMQGEGQN